MMLPLSVRICLASLLLLLTEVGNLVVLGPAGAWCSGAGACEEYELLDSPPHPTPHGSLVQGLGVPEGQL